MDLITAIRELTMFDHAMCDAQIVAHHVHLEHLAFKQNSSFQDLYVAPTFAAVWLAVILTVTIRTYRNRATVSPRYRVWLWFGPLMCAFGVFSLIGVAMGLTEYAGVCRALLRVA